jgi:pyruvate formate lyase activating enzyme
MNILGFLPTSFSDWDGKLVSIMFLGGCNLRCPFCQNYPLLSDEKPHQVILWKDIALHLKDKKQWIDGIVISGGEPLMHPEVIPLCRTIKELGFAVKLDTNGSFPYTVIQLCKDKLIDYVALDIKTALDDRYSIACGDKVEVGLVRRTVRYLLEGNTDYEFRTTLVPGMVGIDEIKSIAADVKGARKFALQQFVPENARSVALRKKKPYRREIVEEMAAVLKPAVEEVVLRGKLSEETEPLPGVQ